MIVKNKDTLVESVELKTANISGVGYSTVFSQNVTYELRVVSVLGVTCFCLLACIALFQILKSLHILIAFVLPYTLAAFIWWYIWSYERIFSAGAQACGNYTLIYNNSNFKSPEQFYMQNLFMQRWFITFSILACLFLAACLPFSSTLFYRRIERECRKS